MKSKAAVRRIVEGLKILYPDAVCSLQYKKDYELLFAVRLSAQCTDARVNLVTPALFQKFPSLEAFAAASYEKVGEAIRSCGFYNTKSRDLVECAKILLEKHGGRVPATMEELTALPGIGRKTANLILGDIYRQPAYVCDTHCIRITGRLGLTDGSKDPLKVEQQLRAVLPPEESSDFCHRMVLFGRDTCTARKASCERCPLRADCDYGKKAEPKSAAPISFAQETDLDGWMQLVRSVRDAFPGLETEEALAAHRATAADFIRQGAALCAKDKGRVVGTLLFSRESAELCFLAVDPACRRRHIALGLVQTMLTCLPPEREVTVTTYREGVPEGAAARAFYQSLGFTEGKLTEAFGAGVQEFVLQRK